MKTFNLISEGVMKSVSLKWGLTVMALFLSTFSINADANNKAISVLAQKIVDLRADVEKLNLENNAEKDSLQSELKSLQARKAQVDAQAQQIELSVKQSRERIATIKEELAKKSTTGQGLSPLLKEEIKAVKSWVMNSMPFQKEKRIKEITDIEDGLESGVLTGQKALARLWAFVEDELRLGRENGVHRQTLVIDGEEHLVSVAKLGMVTMFYKTADNKYGFTRKNSQGSYSFINIKEKDSVEQVAILFDGLKKQIRTGSYTIPNVF